MRRFVPRALLMATVAATATACASGGGAGVALGGDTGGRYLVMIPALEGPSGDRVANELRALVAEMPTHVSIADREVRAKMREFDLQQLDEITARQLAQQIRAELVSWGTLREGGEGLVADIKFIDTRSGDQIDVTGVSGATPRDLAATIFASFSESVEGIRQAAFCNDYLSSSQYEQALQTCDAALVIVPNSTQAQYGRATALLNLDRTEESLQQYERLLQVDPAHQDALLGAGFAASRLERSQEAMVFYNRYLEVNPGNVQVRMTVANDIAQTGDYISAFRVLETAIEENRDDNDFQRYLFSIATAAGQRSQEQGDSAQARQIFGTALAAYEAAFSNGEEMEASALRQAIAVNNAMGRSQDAIRLAREGTVRFADDQQMWSQYATVLSQNAQHAQAVEALTQLIRLNPEHENAHIRRAQAYIQTGQRQPALADLRTAAQRDPQNAAQVILGLGGQAITAGNFSEAVDILRPALEFAPAAQRGQISFFIGFSLFRQGEAIARANTQGRPQEAERALTFFRQVNQFVQGSGHADAATVSNAAAQYIENQEAIIRASRR
jgi:tetratricopeptide (TPR) repeat protein